MFGSKRKTRVCGRESESVPPRLEELESRLNPDVVVPTTMNASIQITPNLFALSVTERVTATVTPAPFGPSPPLTVLFNLNTQQQQAQLDSNGNATVTFSFPWLALFTSQELYVQYVGGAAGGYVFGGSTFNAPVYLNFDNLLFPANVTFNPLPVPPAANTLLPPYNTAQGETDNFGLFACSYSDPGVITSIELFGQTLPGFFAAALGAYGPEFMPNSGSNP